MDGERWRHVQRIFLQALELEREARPGYVAGACPDDTEIQAEVDSLLRHHEAQGGFGTALAPAPELHQRVEDGGSGPTHPDRIGRYRILDTLGEGGMGVVYRAEQDHPRREVALKVIRGGAGSGLFARRFEQEARILARLHHPGIAQIFDAGVVGNTPWIALELVAGVTLLEHARAAALPQRARLELLVAIARAVQHAHENGVIHRDLKPGNILVDASGVPKVLDFGVARLVDDEAGGGTILTRTGALVGTLPYMSPEQITGPSEALDTRSDVYSLGVVAYELLAGRLPFELSGRSFPEAARILAEEDPPRLASIDRRLRGDVETVVSKAMERDRARRYSSAAEMAADLERCLRDEPVSARPYSTWDHVLRFTRRRRALVLGAAAVLVTLVLGAGVATWQAVEASRGRDRAERQASRANAFLDLWRRTIHEANPDNSGAGVELVDVIEAMTGEIDNGWVSNAEDEASLRGMLGWTLEALGQPLRAEPQLRRALAGLERAGRGDDDEAMVVRADLAQALSDCSRLDEALAHREHILQHALRRHGERSRETFNARLQLALLMAARHRPDEALALAHQSVDGLTALFGNRDPDRIQALIQLASILGECGQYAEEENAYRAILAEVDESRSPLAPTQEVNVRVNLAFALGRQARDIEALDSLGSALELARARLPANHADLTTIKSNVARILEDLGFPDSALQFLVESLALSRESLGEQSEAALKIINSFAGLMGEMGRLDVAVPLLRSAFAQACERHGADSDAALLLENSLALALQKLGLEAEARDLTCDVAERAARLLPAGDYNRIKYESNDAVSLARLGRYDEAEEILVRTLAAFRATIGDAHPRTQLEFTNLKAVYLYMGRNDRAAAITREMGPSAP